MCRSHTVLRPDHTRFNEAAGVDPADVSAPGRGRSFGTRRFNEAAGVDPADVGEKIEVMTDEEADASMRPRG